MQFPWNAQHFRDKNKSRQVKSSPRKNKRRGRTQGQGY